MHNGDVSFWSDSAQASDGIESLAEDALRIDFVNEVSEAVNAGNAHDSFHSSWNNLRPTANKKVLFKPTKEFHLLSLAARIESSPDWFIGLDSYDLRPNGEWLQEVTIELYPWDAGTEDGTEFDSLNDDTNPPGIIANLRGQGRFSNNPIAKLVIKLREPPRVKGVTAHVGQGEIDVSWKAIDVATGYKVQWNSGSQGFEDASTDGREHLAAGGARTNHTISNLTAEVEYTLRVIAVNQTGDGKPSDEVTATPDPPLAPVDPTPTPGPAKPTELDKDSIVLSNVGRSDRGLQIVDGSTPRLVQGFTTGDFLARIDMVTLPAPQAASAVLSLGIYEDDGGQPGNLLHSLTPPDEFTNSAALRFAAPGGTGLMLARNAQYFLQIDRVSGSSIILQATGSDEEDPDSDPGWSLADSCSGCLASRAIRVKVNGESFMPPLISVSDSAAIEGSNVEFSIRLSHAMPSAVTVRYSTTNGTASSDSNAPDGRDYTAATSRTIEFAPGETEKTISIPTDDDSVNETDEAFTLTLSNPSDYAELSDSTSATGTIYNNDETTQTDATLSTLTLTDSNNTTINISPSF